MLQRREETVMNINILDLVITTKEASERYPVADSTIRSWILDGEIDKKDIKKSGQTWIVKKSALEEILSKKGLLNKEFKLEGKSFVAKYLGYKSKKVEIWFEDDYVCELIKNMPHNELLLPILEIYQKEHKLPYKSVVISNSDKEDNLLYKKEKTWVITSRSLYELLRDALVEKNMNVMELDVYYSTMKAGE